MSDRENLDVGKIIGLIMENPQLIEQISNLAKGQSDEPMPDQTGEKADNAPAQSQVDTEASAPTYQQISPSKGNRAQLLNALKPYVSSERARAIDSMMSIADILDLMRTR